MLNGYDLPAPNSEALLKAIARTNTGRALLTEFLPHHTQGRVKIENYPPDLRAEVRKHLPHDHAIGGCLQSDRILLDFEGARGVIMAHLVHEISCYLSLRRSNLCQKQVEVAAMKHQIQFTTELRDRDPAYEYFIRSQLSQFIELNEILESIAA